MTVKGLGNSGVPSQDPRRTDGTASGARAGAVRPGDAVRAPSRVDAADNADVLELSTDALHGRAAAGEPPRDTMSPELVKAIAIRIANGSYDRPEVQDVVLDRLAPHLETLGEPAP